MEKTQGHAMNIGVLRALHRAKQSLSMSSNLSYHVGEVIVEFTGRNKLRVSRQQVMTQRSMTILPRGMVAVSNQRSKMIIFDRWNEGELPPPPCDNERYVLEWVGGDMPTGFVASFIDDAAQLGLIGRDEFGPIVTVLTARPKVAGWKTLDDGSFWPIYEQQAS